MRSFYEPQYSTILQEPFNKAAAKKYVLLFTRNMAMTAVPRIPLVVPNVHTKTHKAIFHADLSHRLPLCGKLLAGLVAATTLRFIFEPIKSGERRINTVTIN
jgi:hypothetical protein